uniref:Amidohydrolase-related domain-containing protein n=1 Tax=Prasinoderma coloniale TaxID=156133 RepID=A0A7R9XV14_9VIRI|eukprot:PRCOL_00001136-RA
MAASGGRAVDAAVHLWAPMDGKPPGDAQTLLQRMDAAGVAHAVVVQPGVIADPFDHSYVADAVAAHPDRLTGVLLADPRPGGGGARALRELVSERGFRGVRFNPGLDPAGDMTGAVWKEMYAAAGELSAPVGHMTFNSLPQHAGAIRALAEEFPQTVAIVDHMGFCRSDDEWDVLLSFADLPQVRVKLSAFFRCGAGSAPGGLAERIRQLVDAFGTERLLWGSDWPWVDAEDGGYEGACDMLRAHGGLSESEVEQIMSATPRDLYNLGA